ncbi:hypothetical protein Adt_12465 [Abeliophyllum distichum]|uniref:Uncharacterized protein n=1 Tax=Abeliophyllum distichum TaxID=126358 RepID=A0ABD1UQS7_9LAMI
MGKSNSLINLTFLLHQSLEKKNGLTRELAHKSDSRYGSPILDIEIRVAPKSVVVRLPLTVPTGLRDYLSLIEDVGRRRELKFRVTERGRSTERVRVAWVRDAGNGVWNFVWVFTAVEKMDEKVSYYVAGSMEVNGERTERRENGNEGFIWGKVLMCLNNGEAMILL